MKKSIDSPVLMVFVDGLGINEDREHNPVLKLRLPTLQGFFDGSRGTMRATDASLGFPGTPQSATGQTALFTGINPLFAVGSHKSGFPGPTLIRMIEAGSIFKRVKMMGLRCTFANAYTRYLSRFNVRHVSVTTWCVLTANLEFRTLGDLLREKAVYQDFTNNVLHERGYYVPLWTPRKAAAVLLGIARQRDFTLFEYFLTDIAGHARRPVFTAWVLKNLDAFLQTLVENLPATMTLIVVSDHGNIEDDSVATHTHNRVPTVCFGPAATCFSEVDTLTDIVPSLLSFLDENLSSSKKVIGRENRK